MSTHHVRVSQTVVIGGRRHHRWARRFHNPLYWLVGIWALEVGFWLAVGLVWAIAGIIRFVRRAK